MFDPTIFENLKVAFENHVYDLDNLDQQIEIINRVDRVDFATLAREFSIQFTLADQRDVTAEIILKASLEDLAGEILGTSEKNLGCFLSLCFSKTVQNVPIQCKKIKHVLNAIWENETEITQTLSFIYEEETPSYLDSIEVKFHDKINEEHMSDIADFLEHVLESLEVLIDI